MSRRGKSTETKNTGVAARHWKGNGVTPKAGAEVRLSFWSDAEVLNRSRVTVAKLGEYTKTHRTVGFKRVNCMEWEMVK